MNCTQHLYNAFFDQKAPVRLSYGGKPVAVGPDWKTETVEMDGYQLEKRSFSPDEQLTITLEIRRYFGHPVAE